VAKLVLLAPLIRTPASACAGTGGRRAMNIDR
jgi:hypothetical protein